jgi:transposase InsO family protein
VKANQGFKTTVKELCGLLGYSKQSYYKRLRQKEKAVLQDDLIVELVKSKRKLWKKGSGRNLLAAMQGDFAAHNISIGRDRFFDLLREHNLLQKRSRRRAYTTNSYHHYHKYPNLIKDKEPTGPNQIMVSDITYVWLTEIEGFAYLSLITDMYSRKIIGFDVSDTLEASGALRALKMATRGNNVKGCIHHSDRGVQYCCHDYTNYLKSRGIAISMTENGDPLENAIAERVNRTIKEEFTDNKTISFNSLIEAQRELPKFIHFYNTQRPHRSVEMLTPEQAHQKQGPLKRYWKTYYRNRHEAETIGVN